MRRAFQIAGSVVTMLTLFGFIAMLFYGEPRSGLGLVIMTGISWALYKLGGAQL
jgi:hypothetical protein